MQYFANSDRGRVRARNQDRFLMLPLGERAFFAAVFDGMGGHADGDLAADTARDRFRNVFRVAPASVEEAAALLRTAAIDANADIRALVSKDPDRRAGMGTTVTALLFLGDCALSLNVGDSRTYLHRAGALTLLTHDDSYVQALVDAGRLDPLDADFHPRRNVLTRSLGALGRNDITVNRVDIKRGDTLLLCSDGLYGMLAEGFMERLLSQQLSPIMTVGYLIAAANEHGGDDNITVALVRV